MNNILQINSKDNVAVALNNLPAGTVLEVSGTRVVTTEEIPTGHKLAVREIRVEGDVVKYGAPIGRAKKTINPGDWVHTHNIETRLAETQEYAYQPEPQVPLEIGDQSQTFMGYLRSPNKAGIRNEIWIIPTVSCTNHIATMIAKQAMEQIKDTSWGDNIDGVYEFKHPYGCSQLGEDHKATQRLLAALAKHPNAAGVLVLGLGCENNLISQFQQVLGEYDGERIKFLVCQEVEDEVSVGVELIMGLAKQASYAKREELPLSYLSIGLKCGGSDGFSGITANPLVGVVSDLLIAQGGTSVLTEVPEMFGAEQLLMNRARDEVVFSKIVLLINDFKQYFVEHKQPVYENPSPGNKEGGISTLEDKSLGCTQKGGTSPVVDVLDYAASANTKGLNLMNSPGNDLVASTALAAAGCQIVLFTTGRGTPFGTCVPTIKIATNSQLFRHKANWMDFNAGVLLEGKTLKELGWELQNYITAVASGDCVTKNEEMGFREIAIWKDGVTL